MQPSNLIAVGVSALIAVNVVGTTSAQAEPLTHPHQTTSTDGSRASQPILSSDQLNGTVNSIEAEDAIAQQSLEQTTRQNEQRLDQLQLQQQVQQQLNQGRPQIQNNTTVPSDASWRLQLEQNMQQQMNLQDLRRQSSTTPSNDLDRLQLQQNVQQQLNQQPNLQPSQQPNPPRGVQNNRTQFNQSAIAQAIPAPAAQSQPEQSKPEATAETQERAAQAQPVEPTPQQAERVDKPGELRRRRRDRAGNTVEVGQQPQSGTSTPSGQVGTTAPSATQASGAAAQAGKAPQNAATPAGELAPQAQGTDQANPAPSTPNARPNRALSQTAPNSTTSSEQAPPASSISPPTGGIRATSDAPAPEYLNPSANPLNLPTQPGEVELVGTQPITLKQAVELSLRNNPTLQQAREELSRTQEQLREAESQNFPTLTFNTNFTQAGQQSAVQQQPFLFSTNATTGQPSLVANPNAGDTNIQYNDSTTFGSNLQLSYSVYSSGRREALIRAASRQVQLQQLEVERQTEQLILDTTNSYYDLQQNGAEVEIFRANLVQAEQSLRDAQALERAGVGTRFDVLQAQVDVANASQNLTQQLSQLEIARRQLVQQLNLAQQMDLAAADPIEVAGTWEPSLEDTIVQAYKNRAEMEQPLVQREIAQQNRRAALAQLGPQVNLTGSFGVQNDIDQNNGFLYNYQAALGVSLLLFDGGQARAQARQQNANIAIAESQFENNRSQVRFGVEQAYSQLQANFTNIQTTSLAVQVATEALRLARLRFQAGVGTQTDVLRQQSALAESQVNNLTAILGYNRALATLRRSVSNYPEGFLNEVP